MLPIKISLVLLGNLKYPINIRQLEAWESKLLNIKKRSEVGLLPNSKGVEWEFTDEQLLSVLKHEPDSDFTLGLLSVPLQANYYMRRLSDHVAVLTLDEMADIVLYENFSLEQYILRNAYELAVLFAANGKLIPTDCPTWAHDEVRNCLFDMNANKTDIIFSLDRPGLCAECKTRLLSKLVPANFLPILNIELNRIRKLLFFRISGWVKQHPVMALTITAASGILLNLIASVIFEKTKNILPWLG